jgi:hypothetical protein
LLTISSRDGTIKKIFPFNGIIFNETGVYNKTSKKQIITNSISNYSSLIRYPYLI